jgi:diguanylate cyclase (GGDEF)-like protein
MLGFVAVLFGLSGQAGQVLLPAEAQRLLRFSNFLLMAVASLSLVMHYRALVCSLHEQISLLAETDALTGLLNRRALRTAAERLRDAQRRNPQAMALLMVDIDHFKQLNDQHGHAVGDRALQHFARVLEDVLRRGDLAARWGGEEFLVLLTHTGVEGAQRLGERLLDSLRASPLELDDGSLLPLRATAGVAALAGDEDLDEALRHADLALYDGKRGGRNCVRLARDTLVA